MKFKESAIAHKYLDGLKGIEIGGAAHNPFGLDTINVDRYESMETVFKKAEFDLCGEKMPVDVVAPGDKLPFPDKSFDFVISSHVIEHIFDPIGALLEWQRVARRYILIIAPCRDQLEREHPLTRVSHLQTRHLYSYMFPERDQDIHHSHWNLAAFLDLLAFLKLPVQEARERDDKVGNGFLVLIDLSINPKS